MDCRHATSLLGGYLNVRCVCLWRGDGPAVLTQSLYVESDRFAHV